MSGGGEAPAAESDTASAPMIDMQRSSVTDVYNQNCGNCHGVNAQGGGGGTKSLNTLDKFDQKWDKPFFDAIKDGVPEMGMEPFGKTMNDETIWAMVVHIRELQAKALRAQYGDPKAVNGIYNSQREKFKIEDVVSSGLKLPWSIDWLADGKMLVTNRGGGMYVYNNGRKLAEVSDLPASVELGQGGLMEVSVHSSGWVYLSVADPAGGGALTKIYRGHITVSGSTATWKDQQTIYSADEKYYSRAGIHFGGKIVFKDKYVFFAVGERGTNMRVQQENVSPYGKIMRLELDGKVPADNPIAGNPMWSTGHRNPQGLSFDAEGNLWDTEHGPRGGDEFNLIKKGANYGWPVHAFSINYNDSPFVTPWNKAGEKFEMPVFRWLPSCAASGLDLVRGSAFPGWSGDLLAGGLAGQNVDRMRVKGGKLVEREELLHGLGRVRDIAVHKDGTIYIALNEPDKVIKLVPAR